MCRWLALGLALTLPCPAIACSICNPQGASLRQDAGQAKLVLYGTLTNPKLNAGADATGGTTDLVIETVVKSDPFLGDKKVLTLPRYVPVDPKGPPKFLVFCDVYKDKDGKDKLDPYRGTPVKSAAVVDYLKGALTLDPKDTTRSLLYYFDYLEHRDVDVAADAFLEFAKASDQEVGRAAPKLSPDKLRTWLKDPQTPPHHLGLYGLLLGACGTDKDAALLAEMARTPNERTAGAIDGLLTGYIQLRPREGWDLVRALLGDGKRSFTDRFTVLRALRFFHGWKPEESKPDILRALAPVLEQGDCADLAVEDLRRWQWWDLTPEVLAQFGKKSHDTPIVRRGIVRYALCCPRPEAARFVEQVRRTEPDLVKDVEESLQFEKQK